MSHGRYQKTAVDKVAAHELDLYAENESALYGQFKSIIENLKRKIRSSKYDHSKAWKLWMYWYEAAAKRYAREFASPGDWSKMFPKALREYASKERADQEHRNILSGEYDR